MRFQLLAFEFGIPSIESLRLFQPERLLELWSRLQKLTALRGVKFFGHTSRLRSIANAEQIAQGFANKEAQSYSFSDTRHLRDPDMKYHWNLGIRKRLLSVEAFCEVPPDEVDTLIQDLLTLNGVLMSSIEGGVVSNPFSCVAVPGLRFTLPRPPRSLGRIPFNSIVDVIHLRSNPTAQESVVLNKLKGEMMPGGDVVLVKWGDVRREPPSKILARRYAWYCEHGAFPVDTSFNMVGDKEVAFWGAVSTKELTMYSASLRGGAKAIVGGPDDEDVCILVAELGRMVASGKTVEGHPLDGVTLLTPSREDALALHDLASGHGLSVAYVGVDDKLWNPFPVEYE